MALGQNRCQLPRVCCFALFLPFRASSGPAPIRHSPNLFWRALYVYCAPPMLWSTYPACHAEQRPSHVR